MRFTMDGKKVIAQVFEEFDKQRKRLNFGISLCKEEIDRNDETISQLNMDNILLHESIRKAEGLISSIDKLVGKSE